MSHLKKTKEIVPNRKIVSPVPPPPPRVCCGKFRVATSAQAAVDVVLEAKPFPRRRVVWRVGSGPRGRRGGGGGGLQRCEVDGRAAERQAPGRLGHYLEGPPQPTAAQWRKSATKLHRSGSEARHNWQAVFSDASIAVHVRVIRVAACGVWQLTREAALRPASFASPRSRAPRLETRCRNASASGPITALQTGE